MKIFNTKCQLCTHDGKEYLRKELFNEGVWFEEIVGGFEIIDIQTAEKLERAYQEWS